MLHNPELGGWARGELERLGVPERDSLWVVQTAFTGGYACAVMVRRRDRRPLVRLISVNQQPRVGLTISCKITELPTNTLTPSQVLNIIGLKPPSQCFVSEEEEVIDA